MRIGLYGMPTAGKTHIINNIDFIDVISGSKMLHEINSEFDLLDKKAKSAVRQELATRLLDKESIIMDGHYALGNEVVFTEQDGMLYDAFIYLYIDPGTIKQRMENSERNKKYIKYDIQKWQKFEIESLREYCHLNDKDFYVIDNPPSNQFNDITDIIDFIRDIVNGFSCVNLAKKCIDDILSRCHDETITLMDGDRTVIVEDTSSAIFNYKTNLYDGKFYTGYQSWKQGKDFSNIVVEESKGLPIHLNDKVCRAINNDTFILTSGHKNVWSIISNELKIPYYYGEEMSAETKLYVVKGLQQSGKNVIAYGDGMIDYYMLKQADEGFLVRRNDLSISKSLEGRNLEGLHFV